MTPYPLPYAESIRLVGDLEMQVAAAGDSGRPTVILLHGFPDFWQGWHFQIGPLAAAGFRTIVPNQRGYGKTAKPSSIWAYHIDQLASDVIALAATEGCSRSHLVGHDWGGVVAWWVAAKFPDRLSRLVILNAPHPGIFRNYLLRRPSQLLRSSYAAFFQLPWLPEALLAAGNFELLFRAVKSTSHPGIFDESDRKYLVDGWSQPGCLTAMLNYYRAAGRSTVPIPPLRIRVPTLMIFSKRDPALEPGLAKQSVNLCDDGQLMWLERAKHWIQREESVSVTNAILAFLSSGPSQAP